MKKIFLTLILGFATLTSFAQKYSESVYLKNGNVIKGTIIEEIPNKSIKIETRDGSIFVYNIDEVDKTAKDTRKFRAKGNEYSNEVKTGFKGFVDFGGVIGSKNGGRLEATASFGSQVNQFLYIGGGLGINYYTYEKECIFPFFVDTRVYVPTRGPILPFLSLRSGYSVSNGSDFEGGLYISTLCGIEIQKYTIGLGYSYQALKDEHYFSNGTPMNTGGFTLKVGMKF